MYELLADDCIYNEAGTKLLCNVKDFEVLHNGKFIVIPIKNVLSSVDYEQGSYDVEPVTNVQY